ncbi:MAG TPA: hypothetical protein VMF55_11270 [Solirubrobacterales bacterium]|nr:hypothetical protein [Solirubrobacterales bacterium]
MLQACGRRGYRNVRLEELGGDGGPAAAAGCFEDEAECFASGYASEGERLRRLVAATGRLAAGRREALEAVLTELSRLIAERPAVARSLLTEVHVAGGRALEERARLLADLARTIDDAYREDASTPPPPGAAMFMVEVIEAAALRAAVDGDAAILTTAIPDLAQMLEELYARIG